MNELNYKKSSVSVAMKKLRENRLIEMDSDGFITLTKEGKNCRDHARTT